MFGFVRLVKSLKLLNHNMSGQFCGYNVKRCARLYSPPALAPCHGCFNLYFKAFNGVRGIFAAQISCCRDLGFVQVQDLDLLQGRI